LRPRPFGRRLAVLAKNPATPLGGLTLELIQVKKQISSFLTSFSNYGAIQLRTYKCIVSFLALSWCVYGSFFLKRILGIILFISLL